MTMKHVLVTGAGGFIGSHLVEKLYERGYKVKAFLHYNSQNNWGWLETSTVKEKLEIIMGDVRDYDSVYNAMQGCDTVFHLAALIGIPYSYVSPNAYIKTNVEGSYNILESARQQKVENIIMTSTSETYGTAQYIPIDEKHPMVGQSPYSATKIAADQLAISYFKSFDLPVKIARPFNTYGPRQSSRAIIPTIITQILSGKKEIKLGNLDPTRDLNFVIDTVNGFLAIAENDAFNGEIVNIGTGYEISVRDLVKVIIGIINTEVQIIEDNDRIRPLKSEVERLFCDSTKLQTQTAWKPETSLKKGLEITVEWLKNNYQNYKADLYSV